MIMKVAKIMLGLSGLEKTHKIKRLWAITKTTKSTFQVPVFAGKGGIRWK
jgi:hypothetical protein